MKFLEAKRFARSEEKSRRFLAAKPKPYFLQVSKDLHESRMFPANVRQKPLAQISVDFAQIVPIEKRTAFRRVQDNVPVQNEPTELLAKRSGHGSVAFCRFRVDIDFPAGTARIATRAGNAAKFPVEIGDDNPHRRILFNKRNVRMFFGRTSRCHLFHAS